MFDIVESLQGPSRAAVDSDDDAQGQASSSTAKLQPASQPGGRFSLWGMATALAENVKRSTAEIAARSANKPLLLLCPFAWGMFRNQGQIGNNPTLLIDPGRVCVACDWVLAFIYNEASTLMTQCDRDGLAS